MTAGVEPRMFGGYSLTGKQRWASDHALRDPQKLLRRGNKGLERGRVLPKVTQEILGRTSLRPPHPLSTSPHCLCQEPGNPQRQLRGPVTRTLPCMRATPGS